MTTGELLYRIPFATYCEFEGVNISSLKEMRRSPLHYLESAARSKRPSKAMSIGTATHCAVLEPSRFVEEYARYAERMDKRTKEYKAFVEANPGREILSATDYDACTAMRDAVREHEVAASLLLEGRPEVSILWTDAETGIDCRGRADWIAPGHVVVGLKTTSRADTWAFPRQAASLGYHLQWAFYRDGYEAATGHAPTMVEIVVETERPHDVVVYEIGADTLDQGRREYRELLARLRDCVEADTWPGIAPQAIPFSLPVWAIHEPDQTLMIGGEEVPL